MLPAISYQIDRGRLEGDLANILADNGIPVLDECVVKDATIDGNGSSHAVEVRRAGESRSIRSRWLVDASSRSAVLKRKLKLGRKSGHRIGSAWFRLDSVISVDEWSASESWRC